MSFIIEAYSLPTGGFIMPVKVLTDSTSYIPLNLREELDIYVVSLSVNFGLETFKEEGLDNSTFYEKMEKSSSIPKSSQPSPQDMYNVFEKLVRDGNEVVGIFISSAMSGTCSTAQMAKKMIQDTHPGAVIEIVDSRSNCMELGFAVLVAARAAKVGKGLDLVVREAKKVIARSRFLFVPETLEYLRKGGRIGGAAALLGSIMQIRPILTVIDGKTAVLARIRTRAKAVQELLEQFFTDVNNKGLGEIAVHHINNEPEGKRIAGIIEETLSINVPVLPIGPVIGLHVGPGTVGLAYYTDKE
jgi:DegV family protein with EDD domain